MSESLRQSIRLQPVARMVLLFGWTLIGDRQDHTAHSAEPITVEQSTDLDRAYRSSVQPLLARFCHQCHGSDRSEGELDLSVFPSLQEVRREARTWQKIGEMLDNEQMPPPDALQPAPEERAALQRWVHSLLMLEAQANAGDPGPVVLRRLNNAQYTYTLRDLTGLESLEPAREFPSDSAAGEGFTNVGSALVMSPSLLTKYLDAGKGVAEHAVFLPEGLRFSPTTTRRDWTNEYLQRIREFYARYSSTDGGSAVNLQGIQFDTNQGGRLPIRAYLEATLAEREALAKGQATFDSIAAERGLNARYLSRLWQLLTEGESRSPATLLSTIRAEWQAAAPGDAGALTDTIAAWQRSLWKLNAVGHLGREGGPTSWQEPVNPIRHRQAFQLKLNATESSDVDDFVIYLAAHQAGEGRGNDIVIWERPRLTMPGRPDVMLRDVRDLARSLAAQRDASLSQTARCLTAAAAARTSQEPVDVSALAHAHDVSKDSLLAWLEFLGISGDSTAPLGTPLSTRLEQVEGYDFVRGWVGENALSVLANHSDQHVRIPGNMPPHSVAVHPAPTVALVTAWRSPLSEPVAISGFVQHAHPECGNGIHWSLELRRGPSSQTLAAGNAQGADRVPFATDGQIFVRTGDLVVLSVSPRDGDHSCDLTTIDLTVRTTERAWNLTRDVGTDLLAGNPHDDDFGNPDIWQFVGEPVARAIAPSIPADSLLAQWQATDDQTRLADLAERLQRLLQGAPPPSSDRSPDAELYRTLTSLSGPLISLTQGVRDPLPGSDAGVQETPYGLPPERFGQTLDGRTIDAESLCISAPSVLEIRLPSSLVSGAEFSVAGSLYRSAAAPTTDPPVSVVQLEVSTARPATSDRFHPGLPFVTATDGGADGQLISEFDCFRELFPPALCYTQIVPVDEVVTLTLYYREDDHLRRLMLDDRQTAELDRLWDELLFVSQEPLEMVTAFEQISEFATQDRPDMVTALAPLRQPILDRAAAFRRRMVAVEPQQLEAAVAFAAKAYRRPFDDAMVQQLRPLYHQLRAEEIAHDDALRLTLARALASPAFLYRIERASPGEQVTAVSDWELAGRLSYFLWSSAPDPELRELADAGQLNDTANVTRQLHRMRRDPRIRRLATEFACQWLHVYQFDQLNEKSERVFPTFAELQPAMYEETIQFFTDLFQRDGSVWEIIDADHTFLNEALAAHYEIPDVVGAHWRRVDGVRSYERGGILSQASILSKQAGASRTSPILRGNWLSEVVLGERLPRPPKNVPTLAEVVPDGLTERELIERHSIDPACMKCHARIDPFGFALENYDAIGRWRLRDAAGLEIDSRTTLPDGTSIEGEDGLRRYLMTARREAFLRQFTRKLLGFALGRSIQLSDEPLLAQMRADLERDEYRISSLLVSIVNSRQFREIRGAIADQASDEPHTP